MEFYGTLLHSIMVTVFLQAKLLMNCYISVGFFGMFDLQKCRIKFSTKQDISD